MEKKKNQIVNNLCCPLQAVQRKNPKKEDPVKQKTSLKVNAVYHDGQTFQRCRPFDVTFFFFSYSTGIDEASESEEESEEEKQNEEEAKEEEEEEEGKKTPAQAEKKKKKGQLATFTLGLVRLVWRACEERKKKKPFA